MRGLTLHSEGVRPSQARRCLNENGIELGPACTFCESRQRQEMKSDNLSSLRCPKPEHLGMYTSRKARGTREEAVPCAGPGKLSTGI